MLQTPRMERKYVNPATCYNRSINTLYNNLGSASTYLAVPVGTNYNIRFMQMEQPQMLWVWISIYPMTLVMG